MENEKDLAMLRETIAAIIEAIHKSKELEDEMQSV